jgi:hypothetical protein
MRIVSGRTFFRLAAIRAVTKQLLGRNERKTPESSVYFHRNLAEYNGFRMVPANSH